MDNEERAFAYKWGDDIAEQGFTMIPNLLIKYSGQLNITAAEFLVIVNIESYRWDMRNPYPSVETLAKRIGVTPRSVTRSITSLEKKGYIERVTGNHRTNEYALDGLMEALEKLSEITQDEYDMVRGQKRQVVQDAIVISPTTISSPKEDSLKPDTIKQEELNNTSRNHLDVLDSYFKKGDIIDMDGNGFITA